LDEIKACSDFLKKELMALNQLKVIVALGQLAYREITLMLQEGATTIRPPRFRHGAEWTSATGIRVLASYHPSQQNTFTGKLTEPMFDSVFQKARGYLKATPEGQ
jgi:uracil-DNA glycosylase family 4